MKLTDAMNERDFIDAIRGIFKAYVPESDAWAKPNFFDINATVIGGLFWSAKQEIVNGIDTRLNPQTASGSYLDLLASMPPLNLTRKTATKAIGAVSVNLDIEIVPVGYEFETQDGMKYIATEEAELTDGKGVVLVESVESGEKANAQADRPMTAKNGTGYSLGIYGGYDKECDEQLRRRMFAEKTQCYAFGSICSMRDILASFRGVSRSWVIQDGLVIRMLVLMEDKYPCGEPTQADFDEIRDYMNDDCRSSICFCPLFEAPTIKKITPELTWGNGSPDICEVTKNMTNWLRANFTLGDGVRSNDIQNFLDEYYSSYQPSILGCCDYPASCDVVYNCVEILSC